MKRIDPSREKDALAVFEAVRWPRGPRCPACDSESVGRIATRMGLLRCYGCRYDFRVTNGTALDGSRVPCALWLSATRLLLTHKSLSALRLKAMLAMSSYETAWFVATLCASAMKGRRTLMKVLARLLSPIPASQGGLLVSRRVAIHRRRSGQRLAHAFRADKRALAWRMEEAV